MFDDALALLFCRSGAVNGDGGRDEYLGPAVGRLKEGLTRVQHTVLAKNWAMLKAYYSLAQ